MLWVEFVAKQILIISYEFAVPYRDRYLADLNSVWIISFAMWQHINKMGCMKSS